VKTIAFFNNKGGVGKTTLVYHLAWMFRELGRRVVAIDLDPQSNLTTAFLDEERLEELWSNGKHVDTMLGALEPLLERLGDLAHPHSERIASRLWLMPGDLGLSTFEDRLAQAWPACLDDNRANANDAFRVMSAFYRAMLAVTEENEAEVVLIDVGPNLGAINRSALVAADFVVVPLGADLFSLQGLRNLGPTLREWRSGWKTRLAGKVPDNVPMPPGSIAPVGYVVLQHAVRLDRPVKAYQRWVARIPSVYSEEVLADTLPSKKATDPNMLAKLKHYRSLMPMAQDARKPMFLLKPADGAIGGHAKAVEDCFSDFKGLAEEIASRCGL
jgi:cellulose biosynthesis protein BcsQ